MSPKTFSRAASLAAVLCLPVLADDVLVPGAAKLDRPTLIALGIQLPVTGDDNFNASVRVTYRVQGKSRWREALPLYRVHPEVVTGRTVPSQFAGSIFDLRPGTTYEIRLHIVDPDGSVDQVQEFTAGTRPVPGDPPAPRIVNATDAASFRAALSAAQAGDVIVLADGVHTGQFLLTRSGTAGNPIVIRGTSQDGTILDGANCIPCNVVEIQGSYTHIENLTIRNGERGLRFQNITTGNVARRLHITNTKLGIGSRLDQIDFYIADNILEGRISWPDIFSDDNGVRSNDIGIRVTGHGHVVAHNRISGYGDAMVNDQPGARALDFYGNDILWTYDNGLEFDLSEGNVRAIRNRFTNTYQTISAQPLYGGPGYIMNNIVLNSASEQLKFKPLSGQRPSGMLVFNNTFVSPKMALNLQTPGLSHYFVIANNLFVGPDPVTQANGYTVDWGSPNDHGVFDYNGYSPDGKFGYGQPGGGYTSYQDFADMRQQTGMETHGLLLEPRCANGSPFASCLAPPASYTTLLPPPDPRDLQLLEHSKATRRALRLSNVNTSAEQEGDDRDRPDLGAIQSECRNLPIYGPRPADVDESNQRFGCFEDEDEEAHVNRDTPRRSRQPSWGVPGGLRSLIQ